MKTALITGAARGLGCAIAQDLQRDHQTAITFHTTKPVAFKNSTARVTPFQADLTDASAITNLVTSLRAQFERLDAVILNHGAIDMDDSTQAAKLFDTNILANDTLLRALLPQLKPNASIVAISSVNAQLPARGAALYSASKAALNCWVQAMAKELGPQGIRVNAVAPGAFDTPENQRDSDLVRAFADMTALGRIATPEDITPVVRFLLSDAARFITGEVITVSGGYRL